MASNSRKTKATAVRQESIPNTPLGFFWFVTKQRLWWAVTSLFLVALATALSHSTGYFLKLIIDSVEAGLTNRVFWLALLFPVVVFTSETLFRLSGTTVRHWAVPSRKIVYDNLSFYVLKHSHGYFSDRFAGSLLSKITNVSSSLDQLIPELMWTHWAALVSFLVTFGFLLTIDIKTAGVFALLAIILIVFNKFLSPKKTRLAKANAEMGTALRARIVDTISNVQAVRQFAQKNYEQKELSKLTSKHVETGNNNWAYTEMTLFLNGLIMFVFSLVMFWFLVSGWQAGNISTGELVLTITLFAQMTYILVFIGRAMETTARTIGEMQEGLDDILIPYEIVDEDDAKPLKVKEGAITFKNVNFDFEGQTVFKNLSLHIKPGERVGLVGPSGAGKTTFVSLLLRQHDVMKGEILVDEQDIKGVLQDTLRENIAVVPQEPALFHRSIGENIQYGNPKASMKKVVEVAKLAEAHSFITKLPLQYETLVGERGVKLSGGQKQRVAIARAMLKDAPILVLDEATSALDSESEVSIQKALQKLMKGKTVIAIAHRLSTLREMDRIIVLDNGNIVEEGTHEELSKAGGIYQRLWQHQAGGFLQE